MSYILHMWDKEKNLCNLFFFQMVEITINVAPLFIFFVSVYIRIGF